MGTILTQRQPGRASSEDVNDLAPLATKVVGPIQVGRTLSSEYRRIPGIGTGAAYQDGDAFGTTITFPGVVNPNTGSGIVMSATYLDLDDEGLQIDLHLFSERPTYTPTDNSAYAPTDTDLRSYIGTVSFYTFSNFGSNQVSFVGNVGCAFTGVAGSDIWGQCVARGAHNIAADNLPMLRIATLAD